MNKFLIIVLLSAAVAIVIFAIIFLNGMGNMANSGTYHISPQVTIEQK